MIKRYRVKERTIIYARASMNSIVYSRKKEGHWAKQGFIYDLTGWDKEKMRQAREQNLIRWQEREKGVFWYDIDSIHERFLKK